MPLEQMTAVFVDVLGFADLVKSDEGALPLLDSFYNSSMSLEAMAQSFREVPTADIERVFGCFHRGLELDVEWALQASHLNSIVFSDSAFVVFEHPECAFIFAQRFMRNMIRSHVPVRIGIGAG